MGKVLNTPHHDSPWSEIRSLEVVQEMFQFLVLGLVIVGARANSGRRNDRGCEAQRSQGQESRHGQNDSKEGAKGLEAVDTFSDPRRGTVWARCSSLERGDTQAHSNVSGPVMHEH